MLELGFGAVKQACYCLCSATCKEVHEQRAEADALEKEGEGDDADDDEDDDNDDDDDEEDEEVAGLRAAIEELDAAESVTIGMRAEVASQGEGE